MKKITDKKVIDYLAQKGISPVKENDYAAYYVKSDKLQRLLESCYIERVCFNNWQPLYRK